MLGFLQALVLAGVIAAGNQSAVGNAPNPPVSHVATDVVVIYDSFRSLGVPSRQAAFRHLSSEMKSELWIHHLRQLLVQHPEFSPTERELIHEAIRLVPSFVTRSSGPASDERSTILEHFKGRAVATLGREMVVEAFLVLGPAGEGFGLEGSEDSTLLRKGVTDGEVPWCVCSVFDDWCGNLRGSYCESIGNCRATTYGGCGWFWMDICNGTCRKPCIPPGCIADVLRQIPLSLSGSAPRGTSGSGWPRSLRWRPSAGRGTARRAVC